MNIFPLLLYFLAGVVQDFLFTLNLRFVAKDRAVLAGLTAFLDTIVTMSVLYSVFTALDSERSILAIVAYAAGIGIGTLFAMRLRLKEE